MMNSYDCLKLNILENKTISIMHKTLVKMWIDQKKSSINWKMNMGFININSATDQIQLLDELIDDFNLEEVTEDQDYFVEKNF